ncbi:unnamed protein product, partial [Closterium sp. NIES-53]
GRPIQFDTWLDDLQLYLLSDSRDSVSLFDHTSGAAPAPPSTADSATRSQWLTRDAAARLAIRNHLPLAECAHFGQHRTAQALYDAVVAHYSSPATAALGRLLLPYLFPELSAFATVEDLVSHLRTSDARYRAVLPVELLDRNPPRSLTVDLLEQHLLAATTSVLPVGAARGTPRTPFFEGCSPSPLAPYYASAAAVHVLGAEDVGAASTSAKHCSSKGKGGRGGGGGSGGGGGRGGFGGGQRQQQQQRRSETPSPQDLREWFAQRGASGGSVSCPYVIRTGVRAGQTCGKLHTQHRCFSCLDDAWRAEFGDEAERPRWAELLRSGVAIFDLDYDAILAAMYAASTLGASESVLPGTAAAQALHTFTLDSGPSPCLFLNCSPLSGGSIRLIVRPSLPLVLYELGSSLYTLATELPQTLLWHHRLGHPSLPRLRGMHSRLLVSGLPRSLPPLPPSPAPPCLPCVEGRHRTAPHSCSFPPTTAPLQNLHMDVGGEFSSDLLRDFCRGEGILQSFMLPDFPQKNGIAERRIGLVMEVARTSMIHAAAPHFLWPFAVRYTAHQLNIWPPVGSGVARVVASGGAASGDAEPRGAESEGAGSGGAELGGAEPGGAEPAGVEPGGAEPEGVEHGGAEYEGAESEGAELRGTASFGGPAGASPQQSPWPKPLSPRQLREWFAQSTRLRSARTRSSGAAGTGGVGGAGAGDPVELGAAEAGGGGAVGAGAGGIGAGGAGDGAINPRAGGAGGTVRPRPYFVPLLQHVLGVPSSTGLTPLLLCLPPKQTQPPLKPASPLPAPSPYTEQNGGLIERLEPASRPASSVRTGRHVPRPRPPPVLGTHDMALRPSSVPLRVPLPPPPESSLPDVPDPESDRGCPTIPTVSRLLATFVIDPSFESSAAFALVAELVDFAAACCLDYATALVAESESASPPSVGGECALGTDVLEDRQEDFECLATAVPRFASLLLAAEGDSDAPDIPTPGSYAEAITSPYSSQWQEAMDAEMASWKSTGFSQQQGVDYFQTFSPTLKMTTLRVLLHVAAQCNYELHSLDFSIAFLQGSLHEEIWLRHPRGFTGSLPTGTQWSLRRPVYGLRQAPREWHDTLKTTLAPPGFTPSTADLSLFLRTDTLLPPFYVLVYVNKLVVATVDTEALTLVKSELQKRHTCTDLGELRSYLVLQITQDRARRTITRTQSHMVHRVLQRFGFQFSSPQPTPLSTSHSLSAPPSDESVELSGPYPELVGCLITSGMGLVLGGRGPAVLTGHADASWVDDSATQRSSQGYTFSLGSGSVSWRSTRSSSVLSSSCEAEIYAGAMAAQELRWLTYLLIDLREQPRSPPFLYVDNKAMVALWQEHRLEHRTKHIAL